MSRGKIGSQDWKILQISCRKWSQIAAKIFFWSLPDFGEKWIQFSAKTFFYWSSPDVEEIWLQFPAKTLFLFLVFIQFRRQKCIIFTKLFIKLVKAAKASPHAKFYNLSTAYGALQNSNILTAKGKIKFDKIWRYQNRGPPQMVSPKFKLFDHSR